MDPDRLEQVFSNLIGNAIAYSPKDGVVAVTVQEHEAEIVVNVHNDGRSVPSSPIRSARRAGPPDAGDPPARAWALHTILVVEDDNELHEMMQEALPLHGYTVVTAVEGQAALDAMARIERVCLVLLDLVMPGMNGWTSTDTCARGPSARTCRSSFTRPRSLRRQA